MAKQAAKSWSRRHLVVVFALFGGIGVLIVMVNLRAPVNLPLHEAPEITQKRLDKQNNAYYIVMEAVEMLPAPPPPLQPAYKPEPDSAGSILEIDRPDDDPLLLEYIHKSRPAVERALKAVEKPWFLYGADPAVDLSERNETPKKLWRLQTVCFTQALVHSCSEDPSEDACAFLYDTGRISSMHQHDGSARFPSVPEAASVIQQASADHQRKIAEWLLQFRGKWHPPETGIDENLRSIYHLTRPPEERNYSLLRRFITAFPVNRLKKNMYQHDQDVRQAAGMTYFQYDQYRKEHPDFLNFDSWGLGTLYIAPNSSFFAGVDGLLLVVALESYRRDRGAYPETLDALVPQYVPELPKNPYDGQGFTYAPADGTYVLRCGGGPRGRSPLFLVYAPKDQRAILSGRQARGARNPGRTQ